MTEVAFQQRRAVKMHKVIVLSQGWGLRQIAGLVELLNL